MLCPSYPDAGKYLTPWKTEVYANLVVYFKEFMQKRGHDIHNTDDLEAIEPYGQLFVNRKYICLVINSVPVIVKNLMNRKSDIAGK